VGRKLAQVNRAAVLALAGRDLRIVRRSRAVLVPVVVVPLILLVLPPVALLLVTGSPEVLARELQPLVVRVPDAIVVALGGTAGQQAVEVVLVYVFAPLFLLVPVMVAAVTAADSVVGERERQTLESLLHSPTTDGELFLGKLLAPWALATAVAVVSAVLYGVVGNAVLAGFGVGPAFPNVVWAVLVLWVSPPAAGASLGLIVLISARVRTFQEASQISGVVVVPVIGLVTAQVAGVLLFDVPLLIGLGAVLWLLTFLLLRFAGRRFRRDRLISGD
jgi:ABC-type Na+ efflux pump permease subunit